MALCQSKPFSVLCGRKDQMHLERLKLINRTVKILNVCQCNNLCHWNCLCQCGIINNHLCAVVVL